MARNLSQSFKLLNRSAKGLLNEWKRFIGSNVKSMRFGKDFVELDVADANCVTKIETLKFHPLWLRFNCHSAQSMQADSLQKTIDASSIALGLSIRSCNYDNENLYVEWNGEKQLEATRIPLRYLIANYPHRSNLGLHEMKSKLFKNKKSPEIFDYNKFNEDEKTSGEALKWMKCLLTDGLCLLKNVPTSDATVAKVAERIAPVQQTIYGRIFDVIATPKPINIAYSNAHLGFHMDLMYYESPPGLQFLHCIRNDKQVVGGESLFLDAFLAAYQFRQKYPEHFHVLTKVPATFQKIHFKRERPVCMIYKRPHIELNHRNEIIAVNWSPAFEGPLCNVTELELIDYYKSYLAFNTFIDNHESIIRFKLEPGDVACFNNRRILHARNGFELNGGLRHLQGCYVNIDEFKSEVMVRQILHGTDNESLRDIPVGNHDFN